MKRFLTTTTAIAAAIAVSTWFWTPAYSSWNPVTPFLFIALFLPMILIVIFMFLPEPITDWIDELTAGDD